MALIKENTAQNSPSTVLAGRASGILCHISSLPSPYGIGNFGQAAYDFVDFLLASGQKVWQILPLGGTGFGNSPYQNFSIYAGNPYFIDPENLLELELLSEDSLDQLDFGSNPRQVDYAKLWLERNKLLDWAWQKFKFSEPEELRIEFLCFQEEEDAWLRDYALFMAIKESEGGRSWQEWPDEFKYRDSKALNDFQKVYRDRLEFHAFVQFLFFRQWQELKSYANNQGLAILGDLPIYIALDSVEAWERPELFMLDSNLEPTFVAGCPPDAFSEDGQLWGNPLYNWDRMAEEDFSWWQDRFAAALKMYDVVRIDHFRGFDSFWAVPYGDETARRGTYIRAPGKELFKTLSEKLGKLPVIAEDLGMLTPDVHKLRDDFDFPGMKILEFAFFPGVDSEYLPHHHLPNSVVYIGTHDNDTLAAWLELISEEQRAWLYEYLDISEGNDPHYSLLRTLQCSVSNLAIMQMQDLLRLGNEARMNCPGEAVGNWEWRLLPEEINTSVARKFKRLAELAGRL